MSFRYNTSVIYHDIQLPLYVMPPMPRTAMEIKTMFFCVILGIWEACNGTNFFNFNFYMS